MCLNWFYCHFPFKVIAASCSGQSGFLCFFFTNMHKHLQLVADEAQTWVFFWFPHIDLFSCVFSRCAGFEAYTWCDMPDLEITLMLLWTSSNVGSLQVILKGVLLVRVWPGLCLVSVALHLTHVFFHCKFCPVDKPWDREPGWEVLPPRGGIKGMLQRLNSLTVWARGQGSTGRCQRPECPERGKITTKNCV